MQTEQDHSEAWDVLPSSATPKRKPYVSLTRRLLQRCHKDRIRLELENTVTGDGAIEARQSTSGLTQISEDASIQPDLPMSSPPQAEGQDQEDVEMKDVDPEPRHNPVSDPPDSTIEKPRPPDEPCAATDSSSLNYTSTIKPPPSPWPSLVPENNLHSLLPSNGYKPVELRVQLPPTPLFSSNTTTTAVGSGTTTSTGIPIAQSPSTTGSLSYPPPFPTSVTQLVQPSPVKKKLSLGDYMSRKSHKAETSSAEKGPQGNSPTTPQSMFKPSASASIKEEAPKPLHHAPALVESPRTEDPPDPTTVGKDPGG